MSKPYRRQNLGTLDLIFVAIVLGKIFRIEPVGSWSWWVILAPVWIGLFALVLVAIVLGLREVARRW